MGHEEMPWGTRRCCGAQGDAMGYEDMPWGTRRCRGVQGDAMGHEEMLWGMMMWWIRGGPTGHHDAL